MKSQTKLKLDYSSYKGILYKMLIKQQFMCECHGHNIPRTSNSWVTCKLCRCFSKCAPCRNQLFSISLQTAFRLRFRVCLMDCFRMASSSGEFFLFLEEYLNASAFGMAWYAFSSSSWTPFWKLPCCLCLLSALLCSPLCLWNMAIRSREDGRAVPLELLRSKIKQGRIFLGRLM